MSDYELTIDLSELQSNETLSPEKLIFRPQYDTLLSLVKETLRANLEYVEQERKEKGNDADLTIIKRNPCFFIDGPRGSGKSTFLRTVRHELLNPPSGAFEYKLNSLCEVDPSELAPGEDFFLLILSRLCHLLEQKQRVRDMREDANYKKAVELLQKMSDGIKILATGKDGISRALESESFLEESVEQCNSSAELKKHFAELTEKVCQICGVQAFLVTIDDADMNFAKCFKILEYVRIYMRCPHIIFIFTGDLKQYSLVVRGNLLRYFGETALRYDDLCYTRRMKVLEELTNQYLLKVFPMRNNVSLQSPIKLILEAEHVKIEPIGKWAQVEHDARLGRQRLTKAHIDPSLKRFIEKTIGRYCCAGNFNGVVELLGVMPLRMLLQFFQHLGLDPEEKGEKSYYKAVYSVSRNYLIENGVEDSLIRAGNVISLMKAVLTYIADFDFSMESSQLLIPEARFAKKMESLYLSAEVMRMINSTRWLIIYMCIVFPYCEGYKLRNLGKKQAVDIIQKEIADSLNNSDIRGLCCNSTAHIAYSLRKSLIQKNRGMGVVILKGGTKQGSFFEYAKKLVNEPFTVQNSLFILSVYFSLSKIEGEKGTSYCLSVFNLVSSLIYLMANSVRLSRVSIEEFVGSKFMPDPFMKESSLNRDVEMPSLDASESTEVDAINDLFYEWGNNLSAEEKKTMMAPICEWAEKFKDCKVLCSPSHLAEMWDLFKRQCSIIENKLSKVKKSADPGTDSLVLYSLYFHAFLNSMKLFKEIKENTLEMINEFPLFKAISDAKNIIANSSPTKKQNRDAIADSAQKPTLESLNEELQTSVKERDALKATLAQHRKGKVVSANPVWRQYKGDVSAMNNALADLKRKVTSLRDKIRHRERKVK